MALSLQPGMTSYSENNGMQVKYKKDPCNNQILLCLFSENRSENVDCPIQGDFFEILK